MLKRHFLVLCLGLGMQAQGGIHVWAPFEHIPQDPQRTASVSSMVHTPLAPTAYQDTQTPWRLAAHFHGTEYAVPRKTWVYRHAGSRNSWMAQCETQSVTRVKPHAKITASQFSSQAPRAKNSSPLSGQWMWLLSEDVQVGVHFDRRHTTRKKSPLYTWGFHSTLSLAPSTQLSVQWLTGDSEGCPFLSSSSPRSGKPTGCPHARRARATHQQLTFEGKRSEGNMVRLHHQWAPEWQSTFTGGVQHTTFTSHGVSRMMKKRVFDMMQHVCAMETTWKPFSSDFKLALGYSWAQRSTNKKAQGTTQQGYITLVWS